MQRTESRSRQMRVWSVLCLAATIALPISAWATRAYVSNEDGQSVTIIDVEKLEAVATIPVGKRPRGLKLSNDGSRLYVAVSGLPKCPPSVPDEICAQRKRDLAADGIAVLDTAQQKVLTTLRAGSDPEQFDITPDGKRMFVANEDSATASVVDLATGEVIERIRVGNEPEGVVVSPNGQWVLVTNEADNTISIIDTSTLKVLRNISVGRRPRDVAFTPDSRTVYVGGELDASIYRVAMPEGEPAERILQLRKEALPMTVLLDPKRERLYVSTGRGGTVAVISLKGGQAKLEMEIPVGTRPWGMDMTADGRLLFTANGPSNDVTVIDTTKLSVIKKIPVGETPWGVVVER